MNKNDILISVIMNCHNGEKFLKKSVKSVLDQSYKKLGTNFFGIINLPIIVKK